MKTTPTLFLIIFVIRQQLAEITGGKSVIHTDHQTSFSHVSCTHETEQVFHREHLTKEKNGMTLTVMGQVADITTIKCTAAKDSV